MSNQDQRSELDAVLNAYAVYGADKSKWPQAVRRSGERLAELGEVQAAKAEAEWLDAAFSIAPSAPNLSPKVLKGLRSRLKSEPSPDWKGAAAAYWPAFLTPRLAASVAAAFALGVAAGWDADNTPSDEALFSYYAYEDIDALFGSGR